MRTTTLLSTVAAATLAISFGAASAQTMDKGGAPSGAMEKSAPATATEKGGAATEHKSGMAEPKAGASTQAQTPAGSPRAEGKMDSKSDDKGMNKNAQAPASGTGKMSAEEKAAPDHSMQKTGDAKQAAPEGKTGSSAQTQTNGKSTVGAASSSETRLTTEQRTQIREKVIATGPKVTNVNFSLNVGTVVPRDVRVAEVPTVIIDMHPEWRGYRYFVVNDQIIIVDRESLRIVAILDV